MSSSSFVDLVEDNERNEYPFPIVEPSRARSPSSASDATPPYLARTLPPQRSSPGSSRRHRRHYTERDAVPIAHERDSSPSKFLSRLARTEHRDSKHIRTLLVLTNDRLDAETRRADQAEQRVVEVLHRLRTAHEATAVAQSEASRSRQEVRLYQMQLEQAQREIDRAQDIVEQLERAKRDAEEEAARARDVARKCREEYVLSRAREEGRKQGYLEGLERGRKLGFTEARTVTASRRPVSRPVQVEDSPEQFTYPPIERSRSRTASASVHTYAPAIPPAPVPAPPVPEARKEPAPRFHTFTPQREPTPSKHAQRSSPVHIPDVGRIVNTLPMPSLTTPLNAPSPSHSRQTSPTSTPPLPVPMPRQRRDSAPVPIHEAPLSPMHPDFDVPPDGWIPYAPGNDFNNIEIPPPHELSRPVSPVDPSPVQSEAALPTGAAISRESIIPIEPSPNHSYREDRRQYDSSLRSRDYAYNANPLPIPPRIRSVTSPQSRTSTRISEYDLIAPPRREDIYQPRERRDSVSMGEGMYRDREMRPVRDPSASQYSLNAGAGPSEDVSRRLYSRHGSSDSRGPLEKVFKKKYKQRRSPDGDSEASTHPVPDITVESPSTDNSRPSSTAVANIAEPDLLSPDHANRPLPSLDDIFGPVEVPKKPLPQPPTHTIYMPSRQSSGTPAPISRTGTPYMEAPVPSNVIYPEPPVRSKSRASHMRVPVVASSSDTADSASYKSRRRAPSVADSLGGRLSPLSLFK